MAPHLGELGEVAVVVAATVVVVRDGASGLEVLLSRRAERGDHNSGAWVFPGGIVDAADYTVWRNSLGSTGSNLAADGDGDNMVTQLDYNLWREHFGATAGSATGLVQNLPVPEPLTAILFLVGSVTSILSRCGSMRRIRR